MSDVAMVDSTTTMPHAYDAIDRGPSRERPAEEKGDWG